MTQEGASKIDHPFFARIWPVVATHEARAVRALRRENLAGLSGRVLEVGAGIGTNFPNYPKSVEQVIAVEPEPRLAAQARAAAAVVPVSVVVREETAEALSDGEPFDAVVCSLVLCSVRDPGSVLRRLYSCCARAASCAISSMWPVPVRGGGCSGLPTQRFGPDCSVTATRIAIPSARSPTPDSR
jgi:2-polyprenyl-3-methyl-5-hydroxy-6-metoxy-1,4-benzoquinol methylase